MSAAKLILASASPRRRELLSRAGVAFTVEPSGADETVAEALEPEAIAALLARRKALEVAGRHSGEQRWVLGADTVVAAGEGLRARLFGKPPDVRAARAMLRALSGTTHQVTTAVCVVAAATGELREGLETTRVTMRPLTAAEIEAYVASGEWRDKAGGYAIQESADAFVTGLSGGGFDNVVGLSVGLALRLLREAGAPGAAGEGGRPGLAPRPRDQ